MFHYFAEALARHLLSVTMAEVSARIGSKQRLEHRCLLMVEVETLSRLPYDGTEAVTSSGDKDPVSVHCRPSQ